MIYLSLFCFIITMFMIVIGNIMPAKDKYKLDKKVKKDPQIAILIPARNESKVIEDLLKSITIQSHKINAKDVYIIIENPNDPTTKIAKKYHMNILLRQKLNLKSKGYALQEAIENIKKTYDLYFIFDADNILDENYIKNMLKAYNEGFPLALGYRSLKNKTNAISISSWLTFILINEIRNKNSLKKNENILFSGSGFYISGTLINKWQTFPFHSLTEDYELSLYASLNNIPTKYQNDAIFYDEAPTSYQVSITQRSRWIKGYFYNYFNYLPKLLKQSLKNINNPRSNYKMALGVFAFIIPFFGIFFLLLNYIPFWLFLIFLYLFGLLLTLVLLIKTNRTLKLSFKLYIEVLLYHPIFLLSYLHAFGKFLFQKDLEWSIIEHKERK